MGLVHLRPANSALAPSATRAAWYAFLALEAVALLGYMWIGRVLWFWGDEWDFLASRTAGDVKNLLRPHGNVHPSILPALTYRLLWAVVGIHTYRPYLLLIVVLHLVSALLLRAVMRRAEVRPWTATLAAGVLVLFGRGYQNILWAFQIGYVGSLVFGLVHLLLADHPGRWDRRDWLGLLAGFVGLLCSAVSVVMAIAVGAAVLMRRGWRLALAHCLAIEVVYLLWWYKYARPTYPSKRLDLPSEARFVVHLIANSVRAMAGSPAVAIALLVVLVAGLIVAWSPLDAAELRVRAAGPLGLLIGLLAYAVVAGYGRASPGSDPSHTSRFLYVVVVLLLPALAVAADALIRRWRMLVPVVIALLLVGIPGNVDKARVYTHGAAQRHREFRRMLLSLPRQELAGSVPRAWSPPTGPQGYYITWGWLLDGVRSGKIPAPVTLSPADIAGNTIRLTLRPNCITAGTAPPRCRSISVFTPETPDCMLLGEPVPANSRNTGIAIELHDGEAIRVSGAVVQVAPPREVAGAGFPLEYDATVDPMWLTAFADSLEFRVLPIMATTSTASICARSTSFVYPSPTG